MLFKYSLWLEPDGELNFRLSKIIKDLAGQFDTPIFPPHVTLLGELEGSEEEVIAKTTQLAASLKPYSIELTGEIAFEEVWSRAMIILVKKDPEVLQAYQTAIKVFEVQSERYNPHLSLIYPKAQPLSIETRSKTAESLDPNLLKGTFEVKNISLNRIYDEIENWTQVKYFPLA